jgi:protein-tyrosine phosphatase
MSEEQRARMRAAARRIDRVNDWLQVGGAIPVEEFERLQQAGVTRVLDLREEHEDPTPGIETLQELGISKMRVAVVNGSAPTLEQFDVAIDWLEGNEDDAALYVHCGGGFGRACTMAVGLLVHRGSSLDQALEQIRAARPEMRINDVQLEWLRSVEGRRAGA